MRTEKLAAEPMKIADPEYATALYEARRILEEPFAHGPRVVLLARALLAAHNHANR